jgi:amidase
VAEHGNRESVAGWSAIRLARAIRDREVSAVDVMRAHLDRIAVANPLVNAIVSLVPDQAMEQAHDADRAIARGEPVGPLHGLPIAVKDLVDTAGIRTTYGSLVYADHVPDRDSLIVGRMRGAGAIVIGKTNTPEFGAGSHTFNRVFGTTRNPYDLSRSAGGSSGGAAAALAAGMVPIADGSDLGGSLRNPASFCNVIGLRPCPGRVASARPGNAWDPNSVLGPMARTVADTSLLLAVIAGPDPRAPLSIDESGDQFLAVSRRSLAGARVAFSRTVDGLPIDPAVAAVVAEARARLIALGAEVTDLEPDLSGADEAFETLRSLEFFEGHHEDAEGHPDLVKQTVRQDVAWGRALTTERIVRALGLRTELFRRTQALFDDYDLLVAPTVQLPPFDVDTEYPVCIDGVDLERYYTWQRSCSRITMTAMPALAMPAGFTPDGLPVGVQFVTRYRGEKRLLGYGAAWEEAVQDVMTRRPTFAGPA